MRFQKPSDRIVQDLQIRRHLNPPGNVLIYVVVLMLIFGVLGVVMVSLFTSTTASTVTRNDSRRARYMAESGMRYAFSEMRKADFDLNHMINTLNTTTYTVTGAGSYTINVFSPWFESSAIQEIPSGGGQLALNVPIGELPDGYTIPASGIYAINYKFTGKRLADEPRSSAPVTGFDKTTATLTLSDNFNAGSDERVCLAVLPRQPQDIDKAKLNLEFTLDAQTIFPKYGGAISIFTNGINKDGLHEYFYEERIDYPPGDNRVVLRNLTAAPGTDYDITVTTSDLVILSPRNYMVAPTGQSDGTTYGGDFTFARGIYDASLISGEADVGLTSLSEQETDTRFFELDTVEDKLYIGGGGGGGGGLTNEFGSAFFDLDLSIGGDQDYCLEGACLFAIGVRAYFLLDFNQQGDGITFTLINGANNRASSAGGDFELSELMGYAGDSRTASPPGASDFLATAPEDRGLDPPKIAVEFDTIANNDTLAYCSDTSVNQNTRDDPLNGNQDVVQYVFWGREDNVAELCRDDPSYDDNRHGPGLWQFDDPTGKVNSSPAVDPDPSRRTIYVGSNDNNVYAIYPDGSRKWVFTDPTDDVISSPAVDPSNGTIYVGSNDNKVYAIRPNGNLKWQFTTGGDVRSSPAIASNGTIYVASNDGTLYALNSAAREAGLPFPQPGEWETPNPVNPAAQFSLGRPAIGPAPDRTIYVSDRVDTVFAVRPSDGTVLWTYDTVDANEYMPGVDPNSGVIYTDVFGNSIVAINPGVNPPTRERWRLGVAADIDSTPVVGPDGTVYLGTNATNALLAVREVNPSTGAIWWEFSTPNGGEVNIIPALSPDGSIVYAVSNGFEFGNSDGFLYAVDAATGAEKWSFEIISEFGQPPGNVTSSPAVDPNTGIIYVGSDDTNVYALTPFDEEPLNEQGLLLDSAVGLGGVADNAVNWLNGSTIKGPWAVRLEVDRSTLPGGEGDYELRLWMKQCDNDACDNINTNDSFFKDTRVIYQLSSPNLTQFFQLDAIKNAEFDRFLFGFTAAAGADPLDVTIANFTLSFIRPGDPVIVP